MEEERETGGWGWWGWLRGYVPYGDFLQRNHWDTIIPYKLKPYKLVLTNEPLTNRPITITAGVNQRNRVNFD